VVRTSTATAFSTRLRPSRAAEVGVSPIIRTASHVRGSYRACRPV
jgi:hypothetical protein